MKESRDSMSSLVDHAVLRTRRIPDVPEDVDFLMEHLNDPNMDLRKPSHIRYMMSNVQYKDHGQSDYDAGSRSDIDYPSRSSKFSTMTEFDE